MVRRLWLEPAGSGPDEVGIENRRSSAYRVRGGREDRRILIAEDEATGRWGIVRGLQWTGDFATVEDALASLQDELNDERGEGSFE